MNDLIKQLVNYVIEAKIKDYRGDQSAETYRLSRINQETSPSDAPADRASKFAKINADYKSEKRLERTPKGPQTRPVVKKPVEEGAQVPKGTPTGPVVKPTISSATPDQKKQTANPPSSGSTLPLGKKKVGDPASRADWATRKAAMDKAIDG